jgi:hypothetical protein
MAAACRASIPAALALLLSPANRLRISALFNNFGWNHVVLSLRTLRRVRFRGDCLGSGELETRNHRLIHAVDPGKLGNRVGGKRSRRETPAGQIRHRRV